MIKQENLIAALRRMAQKKEPLICQGCGYEHNCSLHGCAVLRAAADRLGELSAPPANPPLTLEELREMDGEPVWVKSINDNALFAPKGWAIVAVLDNGDVSLVFLGEDTYRQTWILSEGSDESTDEEDEIEAVYRRKPEEAGHGT